MLALALKLSEALFDEVRIMLGVALTDVLGLASLLRLALGLVMTECEGETLRAREAVTDADTDRLVDRDAVPERLVDREIVADRLADCELEGVEFVSR